MEHLLMNIDRKVATALLGARRMVNVKRLSTDPAYQRPPEREKIVTLSRRGGHRPIFVNRRADGSMWIIDGQHRALAARLRGRRLVEAWVVAIPQTDEQQVYAQLNGMMGMEVEEPTSIVKWQPI
jgi:ParB/Sulfiredoxin domain